MSASTQTYVFEVEELLQSFGEALAARRLREAPLQAAANFDSRPIVAAFLAFLIFAPGCAAAAVFLMKVDSSVPPFVAPDSNGPFITKSDRLPLTEWGPEAAQGAEARIVARVVLTDPAFLSPTMIRGSLEDALIAMAPETAAVPEIVAPEPAAPKLRAPRETRRTKSPGKAPKLVAEVAQPEPAPSPTLVEKLFSFRFL